MRILDGCVQDSPADVKEPRAPIVACSQDKNILGICGPGGLTEKTDSLLLSECPTKANKVMKVSKWSRGLISGDVSFPHQP